MGITEYKGVEKEVVIVWQGKQQEYNNPGQLTWHKWENDVVSSWEATPYAEMTAWQKKSE